MSYEVQNCGIGDSGLGSIDYSLKSWPSDELNDENAFAPQAQVRLSTLKFFTWSVIKSQRGTASKVAPRKTQEGQMNL